MERDTRYEVKMVSQAAGYPRLRMLMRLDPTAIRELYPPRTVQSVYFDTWRNRALEENLAGISHREKVRFRWYGDANTGVRGTLERKVRENMLGWKDLLPIEDEVAVEGATRRDFARTIHSHLTDRWADVRADGLLPAQWIRYEREYYTAGAVRVTIDRKLTTWDQRLRRKLSTKCPARTPDVMIVEAKCAKGDYDALQELIERFPMRVDRCSKFVYASSPGEGAHASVLPV